MIGLMRGEPDGFIVLAIGLLLIMVPMGVRRFHKRTRH
jgi:hypothetical protein